METQKIQNVLLAATIKEVRLRRLSGAYSDGYGDEGYGDQSYGEGPVG